MLELILIIKEKHHKKKTHTKHVKNVKSWMYIDEYLVCLTIENNRDLWKWIPIETIMNIKEVNNGFINL